MSPYKPLLSINDFKVMWTFTLKERCYQSIPEKPKLTASININAIFYSFVFTALKDRMPP